LGNSPVDSSSVFAKSVSDEPLIDYGLVEWGDKEEAFMEMLVFAEKKAFVTVSSDDEQKRVVARRGVEPLEKNNDWQTLRLEASLPGGTSRLYVAMGGGLKIARFLFVKKQTGSKH
jgi:hypothetical protein